MTTAAAPGLTPLRRELDGGAVVIVKATTTTPAVTINVSCRAGLMHEPTGTSGLAHFLAQTIDRGTTRRSTDAIADALDGRGVSLAASASRHALTLTCTCLTEDFDAVLDLVIDILRRPSFPDEEVRRRRAEILTALGQDEDSTAAQAVERLLGSLYGPDHPYGRRPKGTPASIGHIDRNALADFHRRAVSPSGVSLVIVGAVDPIRACDRAAELLVDWRGGPPVAPPLPPAPAPGVRRRDVRPMMNKAQADIAYGFATVRRSDPSFYAFHVLNTLLGQYGLGGRLGDSIRERQGMAYYVFSTIDAAFVEAPLVIRAGVDGANVDRAIDAIDTELTRLRQSGVSAEELGDTARFLVGSMPRVLETNAGIAAFLQTAQIFGLGLDHDRRLPDLIRAVTVEDVHRAAGILDPERATIAVAGPYEERTAAP
jgi:zinc protease